LPGILGIEAASDLTLLLKYLSGRLPVSDFELDFGVKGTALNMLNRLFSCLGEAINAMARPVDAIKHQAKTVTVGTSRIQEKLEGILFSALEEHGISPSQLINRNILVLKNLQGIVSEIRGSILYRVRSLDLLGEPTEQTAIEVVRKGGTLKPIPSRVERDHRLKGTKRIIVKEGNVYIGKGRKDDRSIVVIPAISTSPETPNLIEHLLLLHIGFTADVSLEIRIKALGGKYERIKNIAQENSVAWDDRLLDQVEMEELFGRSAEKIAEFIVSKVNGGGLPRMGGEDN
ncbi:MAG: glutamine--fructose-6-phosphate aminotransferase, partial [Desulfobacterales bacterium]|nr:glutamine--fructose-6-phosphate aminotransferase [Desulfobacterales bacterium]